MAPGDPRSAAGFCGGLRDGGSLRSVRVVPAGVSAEGSPQPRRVGGGVHRGALSGSSSAALFRFAETPRVPRPGGGRNQETAKRGSSERLLLPAGRAGGWGSRREKGCGASGAVPSRACPPRDRGWGARSGRPGAARIPCQPGPRGPGLLGQCLEFQ